MPDASGFKKRRNEAFVNNPGGSAAREQGCTCAVIDNHYGAGIGGNGMRYGWYQSSNCPLHGDARAALSRASK